MCSCQRVLLPRREPKAGERGEVRAPSGHCVAMIIQEKKEVFRVSEDVKNKSMEFWGILLVWKLELGKRLSGNSCPVVGLS